MKTSGAEIIIKLLEIHGVEFIAGIPGGANLPIYHALSKSRIKHILARHEQGAGFIAQGIARSTGRAGICLATSGPGATNLITAIADAKLDSVPIIAITGQVPSFLIGTDAFQEVDTYGLMLPVTKHNFFVRDAAELIKIIPEAFQIALSGRPGPVVIDVPKDIQNQMIEVGHWPPEIKQKGIEKPIETRDNKEIQKALDLINNAEKPVLLLGGGVIHSGADRLVYELAKKNSIPVVSTLMGLGAFPSDDPLFFGMLGMHGAYYTNLILDQADLLIAMGMRFDDRATGKVNDFCPNARIIHMDIDPSEIDKIKKADVSIISDIRPVLGDMIRNIETNIREKWIALVHEMKKKHPFILPDRKDFFHPLNIIRDISEALPSDTIIATDVGQHQMWVAQAYPFKYPRTFLTSGGLGTMGFGLPATIGAALANPEKRVVLISGDGSILMNIQELATLAELDLNVTVIIMNNRHLGLVRQQQELFYEKNFFATEFKSNPDFKELGLSFGIPSYDLQENLRGSFFKKILIGNGPRILNIPIDHKKNVYPIVSPGKSNKEMIGVLK